MFGLFNRRNKKRIISKKNILVNLTVLKTNQTVFLLK